MIFKKKASKQSKTFTSNKIIRKEVQFCVPTSLTWALLVSFLVISIKYMTLFVKVITTLINKITRGQLIPGVCARTHTHTCAYGQVLYFVTRT